MHKKTLIALLLAAVGVPAVAAQYFLVAPMPPREDVQGISVNLSAANLGTAHVGRAFSYNLKSLLMVTGDPSYDGSGVRWNMASGELPAGLTMTKGVISGTPDTLGLKQFAVTASYKTHNGTQNYTINVTLEVALAAATLPAGQVGVAYQTVDLKPLLTAEGQPVNGAAATWVVKNGSLPAGLTLNGDGTISGTPTAAATAPFVIQATYQTATGQQSYTIGVDLVISLAAGTPPQGLVGTVYPGFDLKPLLSGPVVGGFSPAAASWVLKAGSSLPAGLTLNSTTGVISGTPTAAFTGPVSVVATYQSSTAEQTYQVVTLNIVVTLAPATLPAALFGQPYTFDFKPSTTVTGDPANTTNAATFSLATTPAGLTFTPATGVLSGSPTAAGAHTLPITASHREKSATRAYALQVDIGVSNAGSSRTWANGQIAATCNDYKSPGPGYRYAGSVGDGTYTIDPLNSGGVNAFQVRCDMTTDGGGWTVFQRRTDGSVNFYRDAASYRAGFGALTGEHWLGLDKLRALTTSTKTIRIDLGRYTGERYFAKYSNFGVGTAAAKYAITWTSFLGGTAGDSLALPGIPFSTYDWDNDEIVGESCAVLYKGAWWYNSCHKSNLNGAFLNGAHETYADGINWFELAGYHESLTFSEMKVR